MKKLSTIEKRIQTVSTFRASTPVAAKRIVKQKVIDRNYGSIPHLSTSKMSQQADKKIAFGQEEILTKKARDWKDMIVLTEKVDGSNVGIVKHNGALTPISRAGYDAEASPYVMHHLFSKYVAHNSHLFNWMPEGWRTCGEWCLMAHGTLMDISEYSPFVAFDIFNQLNKRIPFMDFFGICNRHGIQTVPILHVGQPISIKNAVNLLGKGHYGKPEKPEGCVWRCEREGRVDFLAKWVRSDKEDGKYLDSCVWNTGAEMYFEDRNEEPKI